MSEKINGKSVYSLREVLSSVQRTINKRYKTAFWVKAEMNKLNYYSKSGHCYPEIIERIDGNISLQVRANLWKSDYERINKDFISVLGEPLKDGIKILFYAKINFDIVYGFQLIIIDIDTSYSLGELEKEKQQTILRIKEEGLYYKNKSLVFPLLPKRIAVISVETSKGYADFKKIIDNNPSSYSFFYMLFPSLLQGEKSINEIISQLRKIRKVKHHFDIVAIIRGGGGDIGLSSFNNYELAKEISLFPLPVITGIGHATNETVAEMVAYKNAITPTELAEFLLQKFRDFDKPLNDAIISIKNLALKLILNNRNLFDHNVKLLQINSFSFYRVNLISLRQISYKVKNSSLIIIKIENSKLMSIIKNIDLRNKTFLENHKSKLKELIRIIKQNKQKSYIDSSHKLEILANIISNFDPKLVFKRGYTITRINHKLARTVKDIKIDNVIETFFFDGIIESKVSNIFKKENKNNI